MLTTLDEDYYPLLWAANGKVYMRFHFLSFLPNRYHYALPFSRKYRSTSNSLGIPTGPYEGHGNCRYRLVSRQNYCSSITYVQRRAVEVCCLYCCFSAVMVTGGAQHTVAMVN